MKPIHRKYVDIQTILIGSEGMEWFSRDGLAVGTPYDESKDTEFYKRSSPGPARIELSPGTFVMLSPQYAHMPGLMIEEKPELIKKVVVKISLELLVAKE
jgi:YhcH/YjgK/YiaL family protein